MWGLEQWDMLLNIYLSNWSAKPREQFCLKYIVFKIFPFSHTFFAEVTGRHLAFCSITAKIDSISLSPFLEAKWEKIYGRKKKMERVISDLSTEVEVSSLDEKKNVDMFFSEHIPKFG